MFCCFLDLVDCQLKIFQKALNSVSYLQGGMCSVFLPDEDRVVNIVSEHLEPIVPQRSDQVKVILGEDREAVGQLLSVDNQERVVKLTSNEVKMVQLRFLCRMKKPTK
jgi:transcription elongation factor SPT5